VYSEKSSRFVRSGFFSISCYPLSWLSIGCNLLSLNDIFWYSILQLFGHFVNHIISIFQFISGLCLINQLYSQNISILFKSITATLICSLCPLISTSIGTYYITSPFLVPSALNTSNDLFMSSILILSFY